jgi:hypothetical protein
MDHTAREHLRKKMELTACTSGFMCLEDGYKAISMTRQFGSDIFTCVGAEPWRCQHAIHYGYLYFCLCPVFIHVAQYIKKINGANAAIAPETEVLNAVGA